ncbi:MAG: pilus assembly protein PilP [Sulfitobacter sp.]
MTFRNDQEPTPDTVAQTATETARLPKLALLGIFGSEAAPAALIRTGRGEVMRVQVGDHVARQRVAEIDSSRVILAQAGRTRMLSMPES